MRLRRDGIPLLVLAGLLALAGGFAWLTWHPDQPWLEEAEEWPGVGGLVAAFRDRWVGRDPQRSPAAPAPAADAPGASRSAPPPVAVAPPRPPGARPVIWLAAGATLRHEPAVDAPVAWTAPGLVNAFLLERRGEWMRVRFAGREGWTRSAEAASSAPLGAAAEPVLPLEDLPPDPERLARARALLGENAREERLGPYRLLTDTPDRPLLILLDRTLDPLEEVYRERYGLDPIGEARAAIVLFHERAGYDAFTEDPTSSGQAYRGIVALAREGRHPEEIRETLVHEIVHLLNRRAVGPALPPWLEEGLADDLAESAVDERGRPVPGTRSRLVISDGLGGWTTYGGEAALERLRRADGRGDLLPLATLTTMEREAFVRPEGRDLRYAEASAVVRWLLASRPEPFLAWLEGIAQGGPADAESLRAHLGPAWEELDRVFRSSLREE